MLAVCPYRTVRGPFLPAVPSLYFPVSWQSPRGLPGEVCHACQQQHGGVQG